MAVLSSKLLAPLLLLADDPVPNVISQFTCRYFIFSLILLFLNLLVILFFSIILLQVRLSLAALLHSDAGRSLEGGSEVLAR